MIVQDDPTMLDLIGANTSRLRRDDVRAASTCAVLIAETGRVAVVSDTLVQTIGLDDPTQIEGRNWCKTWPAEVHEPLNVALRRAWRGIVSIYWVNTGDIVGGHANWDVRISPVFDDAGTVTSVLAVSRPVTKH